MRGHRRFPSGSSTSQNAIWKTSFSSCSLEVIFNVMITCNTTSRHADIQKYLSCTMRLLQQLPQPVAQPQHTVQRQTSLMYSRASQLVLLSQHCLSVAHLLKCSLLADPWPGEKRPVIAQETLSLVSQDRGLCHDSPPFTVALSSKAVVRCLSTQAKFGPCPSALFASQPGQLLGILLHEHEVACSGTETAII